MVLIEHEFSFECPDEILYIERGFDLGGKLMYMYCSHSEIACLRHVSCIIQIYSLGKNCFLTSQVWLLLNIGYQYLARTCVVMLKFIPQKS